MVIVELAKHHRLNIWNFFFQEYSPEFQDKSVMLNQGGELYYNPEI